MSCELMCNNQRGGYDGDQPRQLSCAKRVLGLMRAHQWQAKIPHILQYYVELLLEYQQLYVVNVEGCLGEAK